MLKKKDKKELLVKARQRFKVMRDSDQKNREAALDDIKFIHVPDGLNSEGGQWDENMLHHRGKRPAYVFNKLRVTMKRIINDIRANTPSAKVRGVEGGDKKVAEIYEGLIRNIWNTSDGDTIIDGASQYMVSGGYGAWRIKTEYSSNTAFEQSLKVEEILNPFCLFCDPSAKDSAKRTARDWILTEKMSEKAFAEKYPKAEKVNFDDHEFDDDDDWFSDEDNEVRIAEYWYKVPHQKDIMQLVDGKVVDVDEVDVPDEQIARYPDGSPKIRTVDTHKIMMCVVSGDSILEGPTEWVGSMFPFVVVYGEHFVVDGKIIWYGAGRWAKDAQRSYNVARTAISETIAQAPQAKWWVTPKQAEGHVENWDEAHVKNFPFLQFNPDPQSPGPPMRMGGAEIPIALIQESQIASEEINMTTGRYQNDIGAPNSASSGKQEQIRNAQGDLATYNYPDNIGKGMQRTYELLIDCIPKVYDTERELRILGTDGAEDYKTVNTFGRDPETGEPVKINDLSIGTYDVTVTLGPSYSTKRQEATDALQPLLQANPDLMPLIGDLVFKILDMPYSDDIAERLTALHPPAIQQMLAQEGDMPPEVMGMMQQAEQAMQLVEQQAQEVQQQAQEAEIAKADVEKLLANLDKEQAQFEAKIAKETARIVEQQAKLTIDNVNSDRAGVLENARQEAQAEIARFTEALAKDTAEFLQFYQGVTEELSKTATATMEEIKTQKGKGRVVKFKARRENGELVGIPEYAED
jgi:hypothetical protein